MYNPIKRVFRIITGVLCCIYGILSLILMPQTIGLYACLSLYNAAVIFSIPYIIFALILFSIGVVFLKRPKPLGRKWKSILPANISLFILLPVFFYIIVAIGGLPVLIRGEKSAELLAKIKSSVLTNTAVSFTSWILLIPNIITMLLPSVTKKNSLNRPHIYKDN